MGSFIKLLKNPSKIIYVLDKIGIGRHIPDSIYLKMKYRASFSKKLNLKNPETYNEKLQWLKLYDRKNEYTDLVDKYEVKKYTPHQFC